MDTGKILSQDFKAYKLAYGDNRADLAVVFANRFISNVLFANDKRVCLVGFVLREAAIDNLKAAQSAGGAPKVVGEATDALIASCEETYTGSSLQLIETWKAYHTYVNAVRKSFITDQEKPAYDADDTATREVLKHLYENFLLNKTEMGEPGTNIPQGCLNEATRLVGSLGVSERDLPLVAVMSATVWLYDYVARRWDEIDEAESHFVDSVKSRFGALLSPMAELMKLDKYPTLESLAEPATKVLADILMEWRRDYIRFQEVTGPAERKPQVPISKQTREKLNESIKGAIERDLFGKKGKG